MFPLHIRIFTVAGPDHKAGFENLGSGQQCNLNSVQHCIDYIIGLEFDVMKNCLTTHKYTYIELNFCEINSSKDATKGQN